MALNFVLKLTGASFPMELLGQKIIYDSVTIWTLTGSKEGKDRSMDDCTADEQERRPSACRPIQLPFSRSLAISLNHSLFVIPLRNQLLLLALEHPNSALKRSLELLFHFTGPFL